MKTLPNIKPPIDSGLLHRLVAPLAALGQASGNVDPHPTSKRNTQLRNQFGRVQAMAFSLGMLAACCGRDLEAQTPDVLADQLLRPAKIIATPLGNYIVAEGGTAAPNTSRISILDTRGHRRTLLDGLPSAVNAVNTISGASGLFLRGRTLYLSIGEGNPTLPGPVPRTEIVNPSPASPLFSSVLIAHFSASVEKETSGIQLTVADHEALRDGERLVRYDAEGGMITLEMIIDFPDYLPEPVPALATNVRHSHPYGVAADEEFLYVVDGGYNKLWKVEIASRTAQTWVAFPNIPNPLFGVIGGPTMEVVPTSIHWHGDQLLVSLLSGFPFPAATSRVVHIDPETGVITPLLEGLSSALDALPLRQDDETVGFLALEYSLAHRAGAPGRLRLFDPPGTSSVDVATGLASPASMLYDRKTEQVVVGLIAPGELIGIELPIQGGITTR